MEKNIGFASGSAQPSAPPPTAPPSYEEAVGNVTSPPLQPNIPPYPVGPSAMPLPSYNQPPNKPTMPFPPNYSAASGEPTVHGGAPSQAHHTANPSQFQPPLPVSTEVRIIHQPVTYAMSPNPIKMTCPTCHASVKTATISDHQPSAHICCIVLCLLGCCLCSCLPYCMSSFMSVHHFCPNCKNYIGTWKGWIGLDAGHISTLLDTVLYVIRYRVL